MGTTTSLYFRRGHKLDLKKTEEKQIEYGFRKDQMRDLVQIMKVLQLTWAEVDRFHSAFNVLDIDRDGTVDRIEFTEAVGIEANDFSRECFHIITPKSRMNFIEFIAAITKICIANFDHLCRFAFRIVDVDCDGTLDPEEIQKVVNTIYGAEVTLKDPASRGSRHMESKVFCEYAESVSKLRVTYRVTRNTSSFSYFLFPLCLACLFLSLCLCMHSVCPSLRIFLSV